jgi:hypothetical protein
MSRSDSDIYSEVSSVFSQPITRISSRTTDYPDSLLTPALSQKHEINGPRGMARVRTSNNGPQANRLHPVSGELDADPEPYGPYFSIPVDGTTSSMQRNKSAKDLISRFESLEQESLAPQTRTSRKQEILAVQPLNNASPFRRGGKHKSDNRSPLRRSFGNLLAFFGKKPNINFKDVTPMITTHYQRKASPPHVTAVAVEELHSGPLLYLSPPSKDCNASLPVWTDCTTLLFSDHLLVTWHTSQGNPYPHAINLEDCVDVHSVVLEELAPDEIALLPARELKAFELIFKDKPREKLVASSAQARASWISALWYGPQLACRRSAN